MTLTREERVFCGKYEELCELADPKSEKDLLKISGILRHILNDGLFHHANKRTKLDLNFQIIETPQENINEFIKIIDSEKLIWNDVTLRVPENGRQENVKNITPSDFLKLVVQIVKDTTDIVEEGEMEKDETDIDEVEPTSITVREVISYGANILGGVHTGKPRSSDKVKHTELEKFKDYRLGGVNWSLRELIPISQIVMRGLKPLYDSLQNARSIMGARNRPQIE